MPKQKSIKVIVYYPKGKMSQQALAQQVAEVHADAVAARIKRLPCSAAQKQKLLNALIADARKRSPTEQER